MGFQDNQPETTEVELFTLLDDHQALEDALDGVDMSKLLAEDLPAAIKANLEEFKTLAGIMTDLNDSKAYPDKPMITTMKHVLELIELLMSENRHYSKNVADSFYDGYDPLNGFYSLLESLTRDASEVDEPVDIISEATNILEKVVDYVKTEEGIDTDSPEGVDDLASELMDILKKIDGDDIKSISELLAKFLMQADYPMYVDSSGDLIADPADITSNDTNIGLGNVVGGIHSTISALNTAMVKDNELRDILYNSSSSIMRNDLPVLLNDDNATVFTKLLENLQKYFLVGGSVYGDGTATTDYHRDAGNVYYNAELTNSLKEMWPSLQMLFIKDKSPAPDKLTLGAVSYTHLRAHET